jgi:hypothetical protein
MLEVTNPIWVVQNCKDRQTDKILAAIKEAGEPFIMAAYHLSDGFFSVEGTDFIPYGSTTLLEFAKSAGWRGVFHNDNFSVDTYLDKHPHMLNKDSTIMSLTAAKLIAETKPQWFVRPLCDSKVFAGFASSSKELVEWITRLEETECDVDGNTLIAMSSPKVIDMEWRYFIVGGKIITGSSYKHDGRSYQVGEHDAAVLQEAQALADCWLPHECCCMDVALWDGKPYVVEFNGLNASGFYDHDMTEIVREVSAYVKARS